MKIVAQKISIAELSAMAEEMYGNLVKAVVDIEKEVMAIDAELHADEEKLLLEQGSKQENLWGINLYPGLKGEDFLEFDSMINLRPAQSNPSRGVDNEETRNKVREVVNKLMENGLPA